MSSTSSRIPVLKMALCGIFAALMAVCAQIAIPFWPANICLTLFAVELCAALLDKKFAVLSVLVYILLGMVGVPVFTGFKAGPAVLFGMTGGYIFGYILCAFLIAFLIEKFGRSIKVQVLAMVIGLLVCYIFGTIWFMVLSGRGIVASLNLCVVPFLPGDAVKILLAVILSSKLYQPLKKIIG